MSLVSPDNLVRTMRPVSIFYEDLGLKKSPDLKDGYQIFSFSSPRKFQFPLPDGKSEERETSFVALFERGRPNRLIWKAKLPVVAKEVGHIFSLVKGEGHSIHINTGTHGDKQGLTIWDVREDKDAIHKFADSYFLNQDRDLVNGNTSRTVVSTDQAPIYPEKANHVIDAWCYSFYNTRALPLVFFESKIKDKYLRYSDIPLLIGHQTLSIEKHYTTLAIISEKENRDNTEDIKNAPADQRFSTYESIFQPKEGITLEEVFERKELKEASKKRILIQGSAGIGKSILCQKIGFWCKKSIVHGKRPVLPSFRFRGVCKLNCVNGHYASSSSSLSS